MHSLLVFQLVVAALVASMPVRRGKSSSDLGAHHHQPQHQQQQLPAMWGGSVGSLMPMMQVPMMQMPMGQQMVPMGMHGFGPSH